MPDADILKGIISCLAVRDRELANHVGFDYPYQWEDITPALLDPARRTEAVALLEENDRAAEQALDYKYPYHWADIVPYLFSDRWPTAIALLEYRDRSIEDKTAGVDS